MYLNTGYLNHSHMDFKDKSRPPIHNLSPFWDHYWKNGKEDKLGWRLDYNMKHRGDVSVSYTHLAPKFPEQNAEYWHKA